MYKLGEEKSGYVYFVLSGLVSLHIPGHREIKKLNMGEIVGIENVFSPHENNLATAEIDNKAVLYKVPINYFKDVAHNHNEIETLCKKETVFFSIKNNTIFRASEKNIFF